MARTFAQAKAAIWEHLSAKGWTMSNPTLKIPHATDADGFRLWFKAQAVYYSWGTSFAEARSIHVDIRPIDIPVFMAYAAQWKEH